MFAVIKTAGKQFKVAAEDVIKVDAVVGKVGEVIEFADVLVVGGDNVHMGNPTVSGASVAGEVIEHGHGATIIAFKKRRRKNSRRKRGYRQDYTRIRITEILTDGAKAAATPPPRPKRVPKPKPAVEAGEAESDGEPKGETASKGKKK